MLDTNNAGSVVLTRLNLKLVLRDGFTRVGCPVIQNVIQFAIKMSLSLSYAHALVLEMFFTEVYTLLFTDVLFCGNISHFLVC